MYSQRSSWLYVAPSSHFSLANIPFGIISTSANATLRPAVAIGEYVLDLKAFSQGNGFSGDLNIREILGDSFQQCNLNAFAALGRPFHRKVRAYLQEILATDTKYPQLLKNNTNLREMAILRLADVTNHVPMAIGDYTDFYAGKHHAYNVGALFRGPSNALQPNYTHLPVAYHGRASSIVVSGTSIRRPWGQVVLDPVAEPKIPSFTPSQKLDFELELGMFVCSSNQLGHPIPVSKADDYIFGYVLLNDWSARDVQAWEYVPLGPFTAKNLGSSISPWIVLADALEEYKTRGIENRTSYAQYLEQPVEVKEKSVLRVDLEVELISASGNKSIISRSSTRYMMWSWAQMITHHTVTGCNLRTGDFLGSGTISGPNEGTEGSMLEQTQDGKSNIMIGGDEARQFLEDGDTVIIRGVAGKDGALVGFGEVAGMIKPAVPKSTFY
ncbi:unnamed protein product [Clonostachys rosea]|uniref:Fumarylacetoacetase n=1 Tax=Bionectria ochroleuca TaxID=29856 RepID=A0ABY6U3H1_BIOOC|nr:unnamed protein product [Clonostachys rosea]